MSRRHLSRVVLLLVALALLGGLFTPTVSALALFDDRITGTVGSTPTGWTETASVGTGSGAVSETTFVSSPYSFLLDMPASSDEISVRTTGSFTASTQTTSQFAFDLRVDMTSGGRMDMIARNSDGNAQGGIRIDTDLSLLGYNGTTGGSDHDTSTDLVSGTWYRIEFEIQNSAGTWSLELNGVALLTGIETADTSSVSYFTAGGINIAGAMSVYVDDVLFWEPDSGGGGGGAGGGSVVIGEPELDIENVCRTDTKTLRFTDATVPTGSALLYIWDFGDGSRVVTSTNPSVEHTYLEDGTYQVDYAVALSDGTTFRGQFDVTVGECVAVLISDVVVQLPAFIIATAVALWLVFVFTRNVRIMKWALILTLIGVSGWALLLEF